MARFALIAALITLSACTQEAPEPPPPIARATPAPWFICDGIDAPVVLVFEREGEAVRVAEYGKADGALRAQHTLSAGPAEGAAGSVITPLLRDGAETGSVSRTNAAMLENPAAAFTPRYASVRLDGRTVSCRWLPRTLAQGFTSTQSFIVNQDEDGDIIYSAYEFADAARAQRVALPNGGETTVISREIRNGEPGGGAEGERFTFEAAGRRVTILLGADGAGTLETTVDGAAPVTAPLIAFTMIGAGVD